MAGDSLKVGTTDMPSPYFLFRGRGVTVCITDCQSAGWGSNPPLSANHQKIGLIYRLIKTNVYDD